MNTTSEIENALHAYCEARMHEAVRIGSGVEALWREIDQYISGGGKRLRPRLFLLIHDFYAQEPKEGALAVACAWEMLHSSLLIHDDIIDRDIMRHGKLNIAGRYQQTYAQLTKTDSAHYALSAALLAGDLLISSAYDSIGRSSLAATEKALMQEYIHTAIFVVGAGELLDTESALYPIANADPYAVATYKTASYSFQLPMESGAALAGAPNEEILKLRAIGSHVGIAFQLKDDLLGVFGDSSETGKSNRSDIIEKKRTLLIQKTLEHLPPQQATRLKQLYDSETPLSDDEAEEVFALIESTNVQQEIEALIEERSSQALAIVDTLAVQPGNKTILSELIESLIGRRV